MKNVYKNQSGFALGKFLLEFIQSIVLALSVFVLIYLFVLLKSSRNEYSVSSLCPPKIQFKFTFSIAL